jgi:hypothetical protein
MTDSGKAFFTRDGMEIIPPSKNNDACAFLSEKYFSITIKTDTLIDNRNAGVYHSGIVRLGGKYILPPVYDKIELVRGAFTAKSGNVFFLFDTLGKKISETPFTQIVTVTFKDSLLAKNLYVVKDTSGKYGIINYNRKEIVNNEYDLIDPVNYGLFIVTKDGNKGLLDQDGNVVVECIYNDITYNKKAGVYSLYSDSGILYVGGNGVKYFQ